MNARPAMPRVFKPFRALALATLAWAATVSIAQTPSFVMASTTSTEQSGLFGQLLPAFQKACRNAVYQRYLKNSNKTARNRSTDKKEPTRRI